MGPSEQPRAYRSRRREEQARVTRERVLAAATSVFLGHGYAGATMRGIATAAGVSVPTVELLFGTKARLLKAAIDVAIAGDDDTAPVLDRKWAESARQADTVEEFLAIVAEVLARAQLRSAGLVLAVFEGSSTDGELAALADQLIAQRSGTAAWAVDTLADKAALRPECTRQDALDTLWIVIDPALFDRLHRHRHWTVEQYERWIAGALRRLLVPDPPLTDGGTP